MEIDQSAAARKPDSDVLSQWLAEQRVFISSAMADTGKERAAVARAVREQGAQPRWFEEFGRDGDPEEAYLSEVSASTIYFAVLNERYGRQHRDGFSATETEYRLALSRGLRIQIWLADPAPQREGLLTSFINDRLRVFHTTESYESPEDLSERAKRRLAEFGAEDLSPWIRIDDLVFRADEIHDTGMDIVVRSRVSRQLLPKMESLRGGAFNSREVRLAYLHRVGEGRVQSVQTTTNAAGSSTVEIKLGQVSSRRVNTMRAGMNGRTPDELVEQSLRNLLFGEPVPETQASSGFGGLIADPGLDRDDLAQCFALSNEIAPAVTRLIVTDGLIGSGNADAIIDVAVGPYNNGARRMVLEWEPPRTYGNVESAGRRIEGDWRV